MTASTLRLAYALLAYDAIPLEMALEQMAMPSSRTARCLECREPVEDVDIRRVLHPGCRAAWKRRNERDAEPRKMRHLAPRWARKTLGRK